MTSCDKTNIIAAMAAATAAGAPRITAPIAAIARPSASRIVLITDHPFRHISTNDTIAVAAPPITITMPPNTDVKNPPIDSSNAGIFPSAEPIEPISPGSLLITLITVPTKVIMLPSAVQSVPRIISNGPAAATISPILTICSCSLSDKLLNFSKRFVIFSIIGVKTLPSASPTFFLKTSKVALSFSIVPPRPVIRASDNF